MRTNSLDDLDAGLARNRRTGTFSDLPHEGLCSWADADAVQLVALEATPTISPDMRSSARADRVGTTSVFERRSAPLTKSGLFADGCHIHLPQGMIGTQCELTFTLGRALPGRGEAIDRHSAANAVLA